MARAFRSTEFGLPWPFRWERAEKFGTRCELNSSLLLKNFLIGASLLK